MIIASIFFILFLVYIGLKAPSKLSLSLLVLIPSLTLFRPVYIYQSCTVVLLFLLYVNRKKSVDYRFPLKFSFTICFISYLISGFISKEPYSYISESLFWFLLPICIWRFYDPHKDFKFLCLFAIVYAIILSGYGLFEAISGTNPVQLWMSQQFASFSFMYDATAIRFGVKKCFSLTIWFESFGIGCALLASFLLLLQTYKMVRLKWGHYLLLLMLFAGVFISGSRSIMIAAFVCLLGVIISFYRQYKFLVILIISVGIFYTVFPDYFNTVCFSIFHATEYTDQGYGGSSINMRRWQFLSAYNYFQRSPLFGNGLWSRADALNTDPSFYGGESIIYTIMIDRGVLGFIALGALIIQSLYLVFKRKMYAVAFIILGFLLSEILTLMDSIGETYAIMYALVLLKNKYYNIKISRK